MPCTCYVFVFAVLFLFTDKASTKHVSVCYLSRRPASLISIQIVFTLLRDTDKIVMFKITLVVNIRMNAFVIDLLTDLVKTCEF